MATIEAHAIRTEMCGGGTAYDVYIPCRYKGYRPIAAGCYATIIRYRGQDYYRVADYLRTPEIDALPPLTVERLDAFKRLRKVAERLEARIASRAFPELKGCRKLPGPWAPWTLPSKRRVIKVELPAL